MAQRLTQIDRARLERHPDTIALRTELFNRYILPNINLVYSVCIKYTKQRGDVKENYTLALANFYRSMATYNESMSLQTWIYIVTKRLVIAHDKKRSQTAANESLQGYLPVEVYDIIDDAVGDIENFDALNKYSDVYSDEILEALDKLPDIHKKAFLLQQQGYSLKEIAAIEFEEGNLKNENIDTIKSRLFLARQFLKKYLNRDGSRRTGNQDIEFDPKELGVEDI